MSERKSSNRYKIMQLLQKTDNYLRKGADVLNQINEFQKRPTVVGAMHAGMKLSREALSMSAFDAYRPWMWRMYHPGEDHIGSIMEIISSFPRKTIGEKRDEQIHFYDVKGHTLGREHNANYFRYLEDELTPGQLTELLSDLIWETHGSPLRMSTHEVHSANNWRSSTLVDYGPARSMEVLHSQVGNSILSDLKDYIERDIFRSVVLIGPPGTGKTTILNAVAASFGTRVLQIDVADLGMLGASSLLQKIQWLKPDVLVVNDFDRMFNSDRLLSAMEEMRDSLRLLLLSVNNWDKIPPAVKRFGRIDARYYINHLEGEISLKILGIKREQIPDHVYEEVCKWPASSIAELATRISVKGVETLVENFSIIQQEMQSDADAAAAKQKEKEEKKGNLA